jgi:hypothetical protein
MNILIHEMSHFHTKLDLFQIIKSKSCLIKQPEMKCLFMYNLMIHQILYAFNPSSEENIVTDEHIQFAYNMNKKEFVDTI